MSRSLIALATLALTATPALAQTGLGYTAGAVDGFTHPFVGLDHVLAMLGVGALAFQRGGRGLFVIPAAFVLTMGAGGAAAVLGIPLPMVETTIALSLVVLGLMIATKTQLPTAAAAVLVGAFALFHGHAHITDAVAQLQGSFAVAGFAAGFMAATAALHAIGIMLAWTVTSANLRLADPMLRTGGGLIAAAGVAILLTQL